MTTIHVQIDIHRLAEAVAIALATPMDLSVPGYCVLREALIDAALRAVPSLQGSVEVIGRSTSAMQGRSLVYFADAVRDAFGPLDAWACGAAASVPHEWPPDPDEDRRIGPVRSPPELTCPPLHDDEVATFQEDLAAELDLRSALRVVFPGELVLSDVPLWLLACPANTGVREEDLDPVGVARYLLPDRGIVVEHEFRDLVLSNAAAAARVQIREAFFEAVGLKLLRWTWDDPEPLPDVVRERIQALGPALPARLPPIARQLFESR